MLAACWPDGTRTRLTGLRTSWPGPALPSAGSATTRYISAGDRLTRRFDLRPARSGAGWVTARGWKGGRELGEQVVQRPRRAAGEPLHGIGDLGGIAVASRAAVVLIEADECVCEPLVQPGAEKRLAGRVVGRGDIGDPAARRVGELGGYFRVGQRFGPGDVVVRADVPGLGQDHRGHGGHVARIDHAASHRLAGQNTVSIEDLADEEVA